MARPSPPELMAPVEFLPPAPASPACHTLFDRLRYRGRQADAPLPDQQSPKRDLPPGRQPPSGYQYRYLVLRWHRADRYKRRVTCRVNGSVRQRNSGRCRQTPVSGQRRRRQGRRQRRTVDKQTVGDWRQRRVPVERIALSDADPLPHSPEIACESFHRR